MTVGVAAVGVGAAVVVVAVVQWSNLEFEVWGGATHTTLCISQSRIGFGPTIGTEALRVLASCPFCIQGKEREGQSVSAQYRRALAITNMLVTCKHCASNYSLVGFYCTAYHLSVGIR